MIYLILYIVGLLVIAGGIALALGFFDEDIPEELIPVVVMMVLAFPISVPVMIMIAAGYWGFKYVHGLGKELKKKGIKLK